jgi:hypothetical protein
MNREIRMISWVLVSIVVVPRLAWAVDPNAPVVIVRQDCTGLSDCFETMSGLQSWMWGTRLPSAANPLLVDIGPGEFDRFECPAATPANGHVTFRGSGRDQTRIKGGDSVNKGAITASGCENLSFQDLTLIGTAFGVVWAGGGSSQWSNVEVRAVTNFNFFAYGWYDIGGCDPENEAVHYWFGSKIHATGAFLANLGYYAKCSENWFYGGEIEVDMSNYPGQTTASAAILSAVRLEANGDFRAFGSALRAHLGPFCGSVGSHVAVDVQDSGAFHMHGGIINATAVPEGISCSSPVNLDSTAIAVQEDGFAHTPGTAFIVKAGGNGVATRTAAQGSGAMVQSPFLWPSGVEPPDIATITGFDLFVETDCDQNGDCDGAGNETHLMIYNETACPVSKWFDSTLGSCRP